MILFFHLGELVGFTLPLSPSAVELKKIMLLLYNSLYQI